MNGCLVFIGVVLGFIVGIFLSDMGDTQCFGMGCGGAIFGQLFKGGVLGAFAGGFFSIILMKVYDGIWDKESFWKWIGVWIGVPVVLFVVLAFIFQQFEIKKPTFQSFWRTNYSEDEVIGFSYDYIQSYCSPKSLFGKQEKSKYKAEVIKDGDGYQWFIGINGVLPPIDKRSGIVSDYQPRGLLHYQDGKPPALKYWDVFNGALLGNGNPSFFEGPDWILHSRKGVSNEAVKQFCIDDFPEDKVGKSPWEY